MDSDKSISTFVGTLVPRDLRVMRPIERWADSWANPPLKELEWLQD